MLCRALCCAFLGLMMCLPALRAHGADQAPAQSEPIRPEAPIQLFNGTDLGGFYTFIRDRGRDTDPKGVFTVKDGELRISGEEWGCVTTSQAYADYHLVVEYRWGSLTHSPREDRARDSGVLVHSVGEDGGFGRTWMHSIECQLIEGGTGDFIVVGDGSEDYAVTCRV
ncbi:MAG: DUF1080 domain-containing protein, partial [Candidatus Hydrogenedentes bacterium]|nr:DUF1080 domain-containing protein [Candidatus Hydrogenedentota bacterium]